jgi:medium-chain acyl-[acyl-carrier-protein] hydrolase
MLASADRERWFRSFSPRTASRTRLFCFAHAGGGPEVFRGWGNGALGRTEVIGVTLPGHDERLMERSFCEWPPLVDALYEAIGRHLDRPFAFFGHSFGARLAFELTRRLEALDAPVPELLVVAACRCPHIPCPQPLIHDLPEAEFYERVRAFSGAPAEVFQNRKLMRLFEPALRADVKLCESWPAGQRTVRTPIAAFAGARDEIDPPGSMRGWGRYTENFFELRTFAGDHFFLRSEEAGVLAQVAALMGERQWKSKRAAEARATMTM